MATSCIQYNERHLRKEAKSFECVERLVRAADHHAVVGGPIGTAACVA